LRLAVSGSDTGSFALLSVMDCFIVGAVTGYFTIVREGNDK